MKTADSIEQQPERKAARDNGAQGSHSAHSSRANTPPARVKMKKLDASRIAPWRWPAGQSGNPSGRPKHDLAAEIARAVFENNSEALYKAFTKAALRGNAYAYKELADRAYGKLKETHQVEVSPYKELSDEEMVQRIEQLEEKLGYRKPEVLPLTAEDEPKPNCRCKNRVKHRPITEEH